MPLAVQPAHCAILQKKSKINIIVYVPICIYIAPIYVESISLVSLHSVIDIRKT
jgi:hypothetical protein